MKHMRVCAEVNLDAFRHNLDEIERVTDPHAKILGVIKTDGYGHGAITLGKILEERDRCFGFAVATVEEAVELIDAGLTKPILILGYVFPDDYSLLVKNQIRLAVFTYEMACSISEEAVKQDVIQPIHIKLDTGMGRIGFGCNEESINEICKIAALPNITIEGIFTHFAKADEYDKTHTKGQADKYLAMVEQLENNGIHIPIHHVSNSASIMELSDYHFDMVRAGIILYGLWPSDEVDKSLIDLQPIMRLVSHVAYVKTIEKGDTISYGGTYCAESQRRIATIPVGYGDGYPRSLSNKGYVLIHGKKAPICGRVCMDQFMVDVTDIPNVNVGDEVVLIGTSENETITMEMVGDMSSRFNYEFACDLGKRIPRVYINNGIREE